MATTDIIDTMDGVGTNPGLLIRAPDYVLPSAEIVYSDNYFEGKAVRGIKNGQKLFETPWFAAGTFNNIVIPMVYIEGDNTVTEMTNSADTANDKIKIIIYKRLPGASTFTTSEVYVQYISSISNKIGMAPHFEKFYRPAWMPTWFDIRYEYKFAVEVWKITSGAALDVEGIYLQYYINNSVMSGRQVNYGSGAMAQAVPVVGGVQWTATTDGSGNLSIAIPSEFFPYSAGYTVSESATGSAPGTTSLALKNVINSVDSIQTTIVSGTDFGTSGGTGEVYLLWNQAVVDGMNGGFTLYIGLHSDNNSTSYEFYTQVFGYVTPQVV